MCGFTAFFSTEPLEPRFRDSSPWTNLLAHRGPDGRRSFQNPTAAMHFTRLSILDLSERGMQPMHSRCGRYCMTYNGEIVNYRELARSYGIVPRGESDSEVLLELYALRGESVVKELRGMFAFVVYSQNDKNVTAFRDPFGIKPLYYAQAGQTLMLASEMKVLLRALGGSPLEERRIVRFLRRGEVDNGDGTFYSRIRQLPPGHRLLWKDGVLTVRSYREDLPQTRPMGQEGEEQEAYYQKLRSVTREYLHADVPVGVGLSGGFDSSLLAHLVSAGGDPKKTLMFTRGYKEYEGNEMEAASEVSRRFGFDFQPVILDPEEVPGLLPEVSRRQEHPVTSVSILAYDKLYRTARSRGIQVLLEGHGGDEIWAGYAAYADPNVQARSHDGSSFRMNDEILKEKTAEEPASKPPAERSLTRRQWDDLLGAKLQRSLRFVDRASMAHGVEVRVPYLDTALALPALTLPDEWKVRDGQLRSFVRRMAEPYLGKELAVRPKVPVQDPQRKWLQNELREFVRDRLASRGLWIEAWVDVPLLRRRYEEFLANPSSFDNLTFVMFPLFLEEWAGAMRGYAAPERESALDGAGVR